MRKIILAVILTGSTSFAQLGWESYTGQPTSTLYGSAIGAGLGYMLAPAISNGSDAQWIGALAGLAAGGLVGNYMAGDNNTHQKLMNSSNSESQKARPSIGQGIRINKNSVQSPYSDYVVMSSDISPGSIVEDPVTGGLFRIPR
jgi:outer membrane lipoprotein SlyB